MHAQKIPQAHTQNPKHNKTKSPKHTQNYHTQTTHKPRHQQICDVSNQ